MSQVLIQFLHPSLPPTDPIQVPVDISLAHLTTLSQSSSLYIHSTPITTTLQNALQLTTLSLENVIPISTFSDGTSQPATFSSSCFSGHGQAILKVSICGDKVYTASGDKTVRVWDVNVRGQERIYKVGDHWVTALDVVEGLIVCGSMDGKVSVYVKGELVKVMNAHKKGVSVVKIVDFGKGVCDGMNTIEMNANKCKFLERNTVIGNTDDGNTDDGNTKLLLAEKNTIINNKIYESILDENLVCDINNENKRIDLPVEETKKNGTSNECNNTKDLYSAETTNEKYKQYYDENNITEGVQHKYDENKSNEENVVKNYSLYKNELNFVSRETNNIKKVINKSENSLGYRILSAGRDGKVILWDLNGCTIFSYTHEGPVYELISDGEYIISCGMDSKIKIYKNYKFLKELKSHTKRVNTIKKRNNLMVSGGDDNKLIFYKFENDKITQYKEVLHKSVVSCVDISENNLFVVSSSFDRTVRVWDAHNGNCIFTYFHVAHVYKVIFNNNLVISCGKDKTIKTFCMKKKKVISNFVCGDEVFDIDYKNGLLVAGCRDGKLHFYN
ncbi:hypothetical protein COBT_000947 [Conglomerata obtusa]